ncbi:hypothetical protein G6O67_006521 [Ophiocordyceps sinensis]|uniref:YCII-related domain-containing protein n=1 Tax=Ophiocordyceps sinensis TaxID=72228 RepID=A0A8H4LWX8_9HYPO|nr:hypothetical protein G6O67_006521 [Ophiocordyceps sinensis]
MASSSAAAPTHEFLVVVPDKPGMHAKRIKVRQMHLVNLAPKIESGKWKMGGALLKALPADDDPDNFEFAGSSIVCLAESREEVLEQLREDIYTKTGVWDTEKAQIYPFKCAFRNP